MDILVIGNGGREHAICWKLASSPSVHHVYCAPGNAGTQREPKVENVPINPLDFSALFEFAKHKKVDFTVVGPEAPLVAGITDYFAAKNLPCLGPNQFCAQLEGSKAFSKAFMLNHGIPTAQARIFSSPQDALRHLAQSTYPLVIKADGLAAGKGVRIVTDLSHAQTYIEHLFSLQSVNTTETKVVIEDFIEGEEVSFIVLADGTDCLPLATSQDHKTRDNGDKGPNTGGMGAYSPAPLVTPELHQKIMSQIITPTLEGMQRMGQPYRGFLYAGLMITPKNDIQVLEYNCRFGDPETQAILMRLQSDFAELCYCALNGTLSTYQAIWDPRSALGVVLAAHGYPDHYVKDQIIPTLSDLPSSDTYKIFHAGTRIESGNILTAGGRVLCPTALGHTLAEAQQKAYQLVNKVKWDGVFCRTDIGYKALS